MRNLTSGNKMNFTVFAVIVLIILIILITSVVMVLKVKKDEYEISSQESIYDKDYNFIELENDAKISKKWTGNYYLKENVTKKEYNLGNYAIAYNKNMRNLDLFGNFYQVLKGGDISKISGYNTVSGNVQSLFYKIDDRKYLIASRNIKNDTGTLSTQNYLIIIIDKLGNALLLNNEINAKTINQMIISADDFDFDVANEILMYNNESINLKKIIGSTNQYVPKEENETEDENTTGNTQIADNGQNNDGNNGGNSGSSTIINNRDDSTTTIIGGGSNQGSNSNTNSNSDTAGSNSNSNMNSNTNSDSNKDNGKQDTSWVGKLNEWMQKVAAGFQSIYNGNSGKKDDTSLAKSISLNSLSADVTTIDINYAVVDPENKYNVVYALVSDGVKSYSLSLDKKATTYKLTGLEPNTNYSVEIGYKVIYADSNTDEKVEDTMTVRTKSPVESLKITKVSTDKIYYTLKFDSKFVYDAGAELVVYLNDDEKYSTIKLTSDILEKAASSGYSGSLKIPKEYKIKNSSIKLKVEDLSYNGTAVNTNLSAKIVNY